MLRGSGGVNPGVPIAQQSTDISGTPGSGVMNTPSGRFAFPAGQGAAGLTFNCSLCLATSKINIQVETHDGTLTSCSVQPSNGSFTVFGNANATGITVCNFTLVS
jgi:hypothetical protein